MVDALIRFVFSLIVAYLVYLILVWALSFIGFAIPAEMIRIAFVLVVLYLLYKYFWPFIRL